MLAFLKENIPLCSCNPIGLHSLEPKAYRLMSLGSYRPENGIAILADSKQRLRLYGTFRGDFFGWDKLIAQISLNFKNIYFPYIYKYI